MIPFTGKDKQGRYYYRGVRWLGDTNLLGCRLGRARARFAPSTRAQNPKDRQMAETLRAVIDGPFALAGDPPGLTVRS
jgi:hypothetical protein